MQHVLKGWETRTVSGLFLSLKAIKIVNAGDGFLCSSCLGSCVFRYACSPHSHACCTLVSSLWWYSMGCLERGITTPKCRPIPFHAPPLSIPHLLVT